MRLPPLPKWNKTTDDIDSHDFLRRVQDYERSLLPVETVFPRPGQIWEARHDCEVNFSAWFSGPPFIWVPGKHYVPDDAPVRFGRAKLARGERVRIGPTDDPKPLSVSFKPLRYDELHADIVSEALRQAPGYSHYTLMLRVAHTQCCRPREATYFAEAFALIEDLA